MEDTIYKNMSKQLNLFKEEKLPTWVNGVPFVDEVEII